MIRYARSFATQRVLTLETLNPNLRDMEYAVRGLVPMTAEKIQQNLLSHPDNYPFKEVLFCNIGNPQSVGQKPLSYYREIVSLCEYPDLLAKQGIENYFDVSSIARAQQALDEMKIGTGAYSHSQGVQAFREHVAEFISERDNYSSSANNIFLTNGASSGIQMLLTALLSSSNDGLMIPIPQYPIYSALTKLLNGNFVGYYLNEEQSWGLDEEELRRSLKEAKREGVEVKAIVIINPGNPVGNVLSYEDITKVIRFCEEERLMLIADEVYQENIYDDTKPFVSCKKVVKDLNSEIELASFHSTSKGFIGECGKRGGYMELTNFDEQVTQQLLKLASSGLCSNLIGQLVTSLMVNPPKQGQEGFSRYNTEKEAILSSLKRKSQMVYQKLNSIAGISCQPLDGAMYAFPKLELSEKFVTEAQQEGKAPDLKYALSLLETTGICAVPGSGFGQRENTHHIRLTFLPPEEKLEKALDDFEKHHLALN